MACSFERSRRARLAAVSGGAVCAANSTGKVMSDEAWRLPGPRMVPNCTSLLAKMPASALRQGVPEIESLGFHTLWFPESFGAGLVNTMRLLHYAAALAGGLLLILHVYLGTVAYPGTARGMIDGKVTTAWARLHHPRWSGERVER